MRATLTRCAIAGGAAAVMAACAASPAVAPAGGHTGATWAARTADPDADGRIDAISVDLPARARSGLRFKVAHHRTTRVGWQRATRGRVTAIVRIGERATPDTGSRPVVSLTRGPGRTIRRIRPRDRARPVMLSARVAGSGAGRSSLVMRFSEPVRFPGTAHGDRVLRVSGARVVSIGRVRLRRVMRAGLAGSGSLPVGARVWIVRTRRAPRITDRAGNVTVARAVRVSQSWHTLSNPIDPNQQMALPFGYRSHWLQPWRAYLDTVPAARLRDAVGINFNVSPEAAPATARLLADSGFRRARIEIGWGEMSYDDPTRLRNPAAVRAKVSALRDNGIRPLVLLNSNDGVPGPAQFFDARITEPASAGSRYVQVDEATRQRLVPGLSGFNGADGKAAEFIATSVSPSGLVELSKPLPDSMDPGIYPAATLRYAPFTRPLTVSGLPHPGFERTLSGWLAYVGAVTREVRDVLGSDDFDVEIWNETTFGADFLWIERYYDPVPPNLAGSGDVEDAILRRTVAWLRDPAHGVSAVRIGNGFANQTPFPAGSTSPLGLTALDKHPYPRTREFPAGAALDGNRPVNALGQPEGTSASGRWMDSFVPSYRAFFPEYYLSGIQTETLVRDLSPIATTIGRVLHGRYTNPPGAFVSPELWITETALPPGSHINTPADKRHLQAKATLRDLAAFVNKGVSALYFYAVADGDWAMVDPAAAGGGETMTAVRRFTDAMTGPAALTASRSLTLKAIADRDDHVQFAGDGTPQHPPLYNREVVAFLPFQADENRFVVPSYVMTRDMSKVYTPDAPASDPTRYDLPPETYRLTVGGLNADRLTARATDPLTGGSVPVTIISRSGDTAVLEVALTDSPRLLVLDDG